MVLRLYNGLKAQINGFLAPISMDFLEPSPEIDLNKAIILNPLIVAPDTLLGHAIMMMSQAKGSKCCLNNEASTETLTPLGTEASSCVLVMEDGQLLGIVTERNLVKLAVAGIKYQDITVGEVMTRSLITLKRAQFTDLFVPYSIMRRHRIRHLPIVNQDDYPIGLVTLTTIRQTLNLSYFLRFRKIAEVMNDYVFTATPETTILELANKMANHQISCVVIVEVKQNLTIPLGIITERDIVQFQAMELDFSQIQAQNVMSQPLFCLNPEDSLAKAHQKMQELRVRRLVITTEKGELQGIITQSSLSQVLDPIELYGVLEILRHRVSQLELERLQHLQQRGWQLSQGIKKSEFCLYYQPQVSLATNQITGAEALVRWQSPEKGMISPSEFIPLAEATDLVIPLGEWILRTACNQAVAWQQQGLRPISISINCSGKQFEQDNFIDIIQEILSETGLEPRYLKLELTESLMVQNIEATMNKFHALQALGVKIAIDDFGTGYASLGYLQHFPFDTLKIDRCFVENVHLNAKNAAITLAIIQMSHRLDFEVIAEGVENIAERDFLREHQCDAMQGYLFSRPLDPIRFAELLSRY